jgi:hypothetical protein
MDDIFSAVRGGCDPADQQAFDRAAARIAAAQQARREDARVVDDDEVARVQESRQRADERMGERSARAVEAEQARAAANRGRLLGDQLGWEIEIEIADIHARR